MDPNLPIQLQGRGVTAAVVCAIVIGEDGSVQQAKAMSGPDVLRPSAVEAVRKWRYKPYLLNGQPTKIETTTTLNFR